MVDLRSADQDVECCVPGVVVEGQVGVGKHLADGVFDKVGDPGKLEHAVPL